MRAQIGLVVARGERRASVGMDLNEWCGGAFLADLRAGEHGLSSIMVHESSMPIHGVLGRVVVPQHDWMKIVRMSRLGWRALRSENARDVHSVRK